MEGTIALRENKTRPWLVMLGCCLLMATCYAIPVSCSTMLIAPVCEEMGFARASLSLGVSMNSLVQIISMPLAIKVLSNKKIGCRAALGLCVVGMFLAYVGFSKATELWHWYVCYTVVGFLTPWSTAMGTQILLNNWFVDRLGLAIGISSAMQGISAAILSPIFTNLLLTNGWRSCYFLMGVVMLVLGLPLTVTVMRFSPQELGYLPYTDASKKRSAQEDVVVPTATGLTRGEALKTPMFYLVFVATLCCGFAAALNTHVSALSSDTFGAAAAGTLLATNTFTIAIGKVLIGMINDKFGIKAAAGFGAVGTVGGIIVTIIATTTHMLPLAYVGVMMIGLGSSNNTFTPPLLAGRTMGRKYFGDIYGLISPAFVIGVAVGIPMAGAVYDNTGSYRIAMIVVACFAAAAFIAAVASLAVSKKRAAVK